jgi:hypothetical protein
MKKGPDALGTVENESGRAKIEKGTSPLVLPKMSPRVQNMKTRLDTLGTVENESGSAKHENGTGRPGTVEKVSGSAKQEVGTRRHRDRRKCVREHKP